MPRSTKILSIQTLLWKRAAQMCLVLAGAGAAVVVQAEDNAIVAHWPQFRGTDAMGGGGGSADKPILANEWNAETGKNIEWKAKVPGLGWSSPIVWGNRVFVTTAINSGEDEEPTPGLYFGGERPAPESKHAWQVHCLELSSGKTLWQKTVHEGVPAHGRHLKNTFASETPVTDGERVYAYFGNVGLFAFDLDGNPQWSRKFDAVKTRYGWGTAASPVAHDGVLYVINDNDDRSYLAALNAASGETLWESAREDEKSNWSTPFVWRNRDRTEIVTTGTGKVRSYDLKGNVLWTLGGLSSITVPVPFAAEGLLYLCSGYVGDAKRPLFAIKPGASGDISLADDEQHSNEFIAWSDPKAAPYMPTPVLHDGRLYVLLDRGMVSCFDAATGRQHYDRERLPGIGKFTASPWIANDRLFCLSESGETVAVECGDTFKVLGSNPLGEMCMATPAIAGYRLIVRGKDTVFCVRRMEAGE
jgi:outer membrane protein assembly factor BamB